MTEHVAEAMTCAAEHGEPAAAQQQVLFASLYQELHGMARREVRRFGSAAPLGATTLVHEAYLNVDERKHVRFPDRGRFLAYVSRVMRGLVISRARRRQALKRGAGMHLNSLPTQIAEQVDDCADLQRLGDAIEELAAVEPRLAQVVDLKYFGGFSFSAIAAMWQVSERTVQRDWEKARLILHRSVAQCAASDAAAADDRSS